MAAGGSWSDDKTVQISTYVALNVFNEGTISLLRTISSVHVGRQQLRRHPMNLVFRKQNAECPMVR